MRETRSLDVRRLATVTMASLAALAVVTVVIAVIEGRLAVPDASAIYLLAVVGIAVAFGDDTGDPDRDRRLPLVRLPVHRGD